MTQYSAKRALRLSLMSLLLSFTASLATAENRTSAPFGIPDLQSLLGIGESLTVPQPMLPTTKEIVAIEINPVAEIYEQLIKEAVRLIGTPYRPGSSSLRGFDCSGFTFFVFKKLGIELNRSSRGQLHNGEKVSKSEVQPGDLVFFNGSAMSNTRSIGHVGMVLSNDGKGNIVFIHSARGGVQRTNLAKSPFYQQRYVAARRIKELDTPIEG